MLHYQNFAGWVQVFEVVLKLRSHGYANATNASEVVMNIFATDL
ncbi:hypothetical protein [Acaryochloris sp. IP29b_bin.148]|nr:hypothetical protein [Acaryochloris sp. IP29b_bin.148]